MVETHVLLWIVSTFLTLASKKVWQFAREYCYVEDNSDTLLFAWFIALITGISVLMLFAFGLLIGRVVIFWMNYF